MKIQKYHISAIVISALLIITSFFIYGTKYFPLVFGLGLITGFLPFVISIIRETQIETEKEDMFLQFTRSLAESVKTGTPVSKSITNIKDKSFGVLSPHIKKLSNQISMGIPLKKSLQTFAKDVGNKTISRSLTLIGQAEQAGGDIGKILESVAESINVAEKLKKERKAAISTLIIQGYIIFFIFILIILVMQFKIIPMLSGISGIGDSSAISGLSTGSGAGEAINQDEISNAFLYLLLIQGFFSGLTIGKLSEGSIKRGIKHSITLVIMSFVIFVIANLIFR